MEKTEISQIIRKSIFMNIIVGVVLALSTFMIQWFSPSHFYFSAITVPLFMIANIFIHIRAHVRIKHQIESGMANQSATQMVAIDTKFRRELSLLRMWYPLPFIMIFLNVFSLLGIIMTFQIYYLFTMMLQVKSIVMVKRVQEWYLFLISLNCL